MKVRKGAVTLLALVLAVTAMSAVDANAQAEAVKASYVIANGTDITIISAAGKPDTLELAAQCGYDTDEYIIKTTEHGDYTSVELFPAKEYAVIVDGGTVMGRATGGTVGELLQELRVSLGGEDIVSTPLDSQVKDGMEIRICRVTYGQETAQEAIPHGTEYTDSAELYRGEEKKVSDGADGSKLLTYKVKYIDGQEISRELADDEIVAEPVPTVIAVGTKERPKPAAPKKPAEPSTASKGASAATKGSTSEDKGPSGTTSSSESGNASSNRKKDTPSGSEGNTETKPSPAEGENVITASDGTTYTYSKKLTMKATAYSYDAGSLTSSGAPVQVGIVAALPSTLAPGTRVYIVTNDGKYTYGPAVVGDTPGSDIIDLFFETEEECYQFGVRQATVYVLS